MKKPLIFAASSACVAAALAVAPTAQAKSYAFYFGDVSAVCFTGQTADKPNVACEVANPWTNIPPRPASCQGVWGNRIEIVQGGTPAFVCHTDSLSNYGPQYQVSGTPQTNGAISCVDNPQGIKCLDTSTGNFFVIGASSYQLYPPA